MKKLGAKKVAAIGYGASPSSSETAKAVENFGAPAVGLEGVYLNNTLEFGSTDVGPIVLGIKNSGADAVYLPLDSNTNFAIVQALQQNGVKTKANVLATGYSQDLLDQPIAKTITPNDVMQSSYKPIELGGPAIKTFVDNLKKYGGITGRARTTASTPGTSPATWPSRPSRTQARTRPARASSTGSARRTVGSTNQPV